MRVAIISGIRTPFVKAQGVLRRYKSVDLGIHVVSELLRRISLKPEHIDEFIFGSVLHDPHLPHLAREVILRSGLPKNIVAHTVSNNCITGLSAAAWGFDSILSGRSSVVLIGGAESMSNPAITLSDAGQSWLLDFARTKTLGAKLQAVTKLRLKHFTPKPPSPAEPTTGLTMGEHCEIMAKEFGISREAQDALAYASHGNAAQAYEKNIIQPELAPVGDVAIDNLFRADTSVEKLAKLKPVFDRSPYGTITAGNASPLTDGASVVCLMSEEKARELGFEPLAYIEAFEFSAVPLGDGLLMAPGVALPRLLGKAGLKAENIDRFEIHEAFAAQVLCNLSAWESGWKNYPALQTIGHIPREKMNVHGGSLALGHPFAATGGRMLTTLANELKRNSLKKGVISICAAGGLAGAVLVSR